MDATTQLQDATTPAVALDALIRRGGHQLGWVCEQMGLVRPDGRLDYRRLKALRDGSTFTAPEAARAARAFGVPIETFVPAEPEAGR